MIPFIKKEFITFNETLYYVIEIVRMSDNPDVEKLKENYNQKINDVESKVADVTVMKETVTGITTKLEADLSKFVLQLRYHIF